MRVQRKKLFTPPWVLRTLVAAAALSAAQVHAQASAEGRRVSFVACPVYQNTARSCWFAESAGKRYYIGRFGVRSRPQLKHKVLIEGVAKDGEQSCGGIVVDELRVSVLPALSLECDTVLPDNGAAPSEPSLFDRGPEALANIGMSPPVPKPPFSNSVRRIQFDFDNTWLNVQVQRDVEAAAKLAIASQAKRVRVLGQAGSVRLDDGTLMVEPLSLAQRRAEKVAAALTGLGLDPKVMTVSWHPHVLPAEGVHDADNRDVVIDIVVND